MVAWSKIAVGALTAAVSILLIAKQLGKGVNVVWDLDDTLIKSVHLETFEDESKRNTIIKMSNNICEHIDDDIMYFRTYLRPYSRLILSSFRFFGVKQYVFTSALKTEGGDIRFMILSPNRNTGKIPTTALNC